MSAGEFVAHEEHVSGIHLGGMPAEMIAPERLPDHRREDLQADAPNDKPASAEAQNADCSACPPHWRLKTAAMAGWHAGHRPGRLSRPSRYRRRVSQAPGGW